MAVAFRPSHADGTYQAKYGIQARSGGGRASARETIGRVAAGAIAKQLLQKAAGTEVLAWVKRIHTIEANVDPAQVSLQSIESNIVRCPDPAVATQMIERIEAIGREGDSCGGVIECVVRQPPSWARHACVRQTGSRSRQGGDVVAGDQRLRNRIRLRRNPAQRQ